MENQKKHNFKVSGFFMMLIFLLSSLIVGFQNCSNNAFQAQRAANQYSLATGSTTGNGQTGSSAGDESNNFSNVCSYPTSSEFAVPTSLNISGEATGFVTSTATI